MTSTDVDTITSFAQLIDRHGLSIVITIIFIIAIVIYMKRMDTKMTKDHELNQERQRAELELLTKERNAEIDRNHEIFQLVTTVQTKQVTQLEKMTDTLDNISKASAANAEGLKANAHYIESVSDTVDDLLIKNRNTQEAMTEILAKVNEIICNVDETRIVSTNILNTVTLIDKNLKSAVELN